MPLCIIQDTREQTPYTFACISPPPLVEVATLASGDYSLKGLEDRVAVERKSLADTFGTFGQGRERFERELSRLAQMRYAAVMIEASWEQIIHRPPRRSRLNPKTIHASIVAWQIRYRTIHFWDCPNRIFAERTTYRLLKRFWDDLQAGKIKI
jgi:DNA excision repair protein ERCC-4